MSDSESEVEEEVSAEVRDDLGPRRASAVAQKAPEPPRAIAPEPPSEPKKKRTYTKKPKVVPAMGEPQPAALVAELVAKQLEVPAPEEKKRNPKGAGRKPGSKAAGVITQFQQSKVFADTFKEFSDMLISLKKDVDETKKVLSESINSEASRHKKEVDDALAQARLRFARTLN